MKKLLLPGLAVLAFIVSPTDARAEFPGWLNPIHWGQHIAHFFTGEPQASLDNSGEVRDLVNQLAPQLGFDPALIPVYNMDAFTGTADPFNATAAASCMFNSSPKEQEDFRSGGISTGGCFIMYRSDGVFRYNTPEVRAWVVGHELGHVWEMMMGMYDDIQFDRENDDTEARMSLELQADVIGARLTSPYAAISGYNTDQLVINQQCFDAYNPLLAAPTRLIDACANHSERLLGGDYIHASYWESIMNIMSAFPEYDFSNIQIVAPFGGNVSGLPLDGGDTNAPYKALTLINQYQGFLNRGAIVGQSIFDVGSYGGIQPSNYDRAAAIVNAFAPQGYDFSGTTIVDPLGNNISVLDLTADPCNPYSIRADGSGMGEGYLSFQGQAICASVNNFFSVMNEGTGGAWGAPGFADYYLPEEMMSAMMRQAQATSMPGMTLFSGNEKLDAYASYVQGSQPDFYRYAVTGFSPDYYPRVSSCDPYNDPYNYAYGNCDYSENGNPYGYYDYF
jgi:hypothetical protein